MVPSDYSHSSYYSRGCFLKRPEYMGVIYYSTTTFDNGMGGSVSYCLILLNETTPPLFNDVAHKLQPSHPDSMLDYHSNAFFVRAFILPRKTTFWNWSSGSIDFCLSHVSNCLTPFLYCCRSRPAFDVPNKIIGCLGFIDTEMSTFFHPTEMLWRFYEKELRFLHICCHLYFDVG